MKVTPKRVLGSVDADIHSSDSSSALNAKRYKTAAVPSAKLTLGEIKTPHTDTLSSVAASSHVQPQQQQQQQQQKLSQEEPKPLQHDPRHACRLGSYARLELSECERARYKAAGAMLYRFHKHKAYVLMGAELRDGFVFPQLIWLGGKREDKQDHGDPAATAKREVSEEARMLVSLDADRHKQQCVFWFEAGKYVLYVKHAPKQLHNVPREFQQARTDALARQHALDAITQDDTTQEPLSKMKALLWVNLEDLVLRRESIQCIEDDCLGAPPVYKMVREMFEEPALVGLCCGLIEAAAASASDVHETKKTSV